MKLAAAALLSFASAILGGCVTGAPLTLPAVTYDCSVRAFDSGRPIAGAKITVRYVGADPHTEPKEIFHGPFVTDSAGHARFSVEKRSVWLSGSAAFAGGYLCEVVAEADGFLERHSPIKFPGELKPLETETFELRPKK